MESSQFITPFLFLSLSLSLSVNIHKCMESSQFIIPLPLSLSLSLTFRQTGQPLSKQPNWPESGNQTCSLFPNEDQRIGVVVMSHPFLNICHFKGFVCQHDCDIVLTSPLTHPWRFLLWHYVRTLLFCIGVICIQPWFASQMKGRCPSDDLNV